MQLSIITINQNNEDGLRKTMTSVLSQSWVDFEYIIIDGASTDKSVDIIEEEINNASKSLIAKIQYTSEADTGVFNAMNKGIICAKGKYLLFLNSGDFLVDNQVLEVVFKEKHETDIVSCKCRVSENGKQMFVTSPPTNYTFGFFFSNSLAHQATFIKKTLFDNFGLYRDDLKLMGDWEFFVRTIILGSASSKNLDIILSDYNMDGMSSDNTNQNLIAKEKKMIYEDKVLKSFVPDYEFFSKYKSDNAMMEWAGSKKLFRLPIHIIYKLILKLKKVFK